MINKLIAMMLYLSSIQRLVVVKIAMQLFAVELAYTCDWSNDDLLSTLCIATILAAGSAYFAIISISRLKKEKKDLSKSGKRLVVCSIATDILIVAGFMFWVMPYLVQRDLYEVFGLI